MTDDGQLGFGHLRFQEYLAACELRNNRGIAVGPLMYKRWWQGALILFAQMTDEIEFIVARIIKQGTTSRVYDLLDSMLRERPQKEQFALREILQRNLMLDQLEVEKHAYNSEEFDEETMELLTNIDVCDLSEFE